MTGDPPIIPVRIDHPYANWPKVHPFLRARADALNSHPDIGGRLGTGRAAATREQQAHFFWLYKHHEGHLAADPDEVHPDGTVGSRHEIQRDGWGHAIDFSFHDGLEPKTVHKHSPDFGICWPVRGENWHAQGWTTFCEWLPVTGGRDAHPDSLPQRLYQRALASLPNPADRLAPPYRLQADMPKIVAARPLRRGYKGADVFAVQMALNHLQIATGGEPAPKADGVFGPATFNAVRAFQHAEHLAPDGIVGPDTWGKLAALTAPKPAAAVGQSYTLTHNPAAVVCGPDDVKEDREDHT